MHAWTRRRRGWMTQKPPVAEEEPEPQSLSKLRGVHAEGQHVPPATPEGRDRSPR